MSLFTALNFTPDEAQQEAEHHSRELQVEESFEVYQNALLHMKFKRFEEAEEKFKELFSIDVIKPDKWGSYKHSTVVLDSLRYLAYRNRGIFYYQWLQDRYTTMEPQDIVEFTLKTVEDLLDAMQHGECDSVVTRVLFDIFASFRSPKLQRYVLEHELLKDSDTNISILRRKSVLPETRNVIRQLLRLLKDLDDHSTLQAGFVSQLGKFLQGRTTHIDHDDDIHGKTNGNCKLVPFLTQIKIMRGEDNTNLKSPNVVSVEINELSWEAIAESLTSALPKYKLSNFFSRISDPYNEAEEPIEHLKFKRKDNAEGQELNETEQGSIDSNKKVLGSEVAADATPPPTTDVAETNRQPIAEASGVKRLIDSADGGDKPLQRSSKRFKEKPILDTPLKSMDAHEYFFLVINDLAFTMGFDFNLSTERMSPSDLEEAAPEFSAMSDFYDCLSSWTNKHSEFLNQTESKSSKNSESDVESLFQLNAVIRTSVLTGDSCPIESLTDLPSEEIQDFVNQVNKDGMHYQEVRLRLLNVLLSTDGDGRCLIIDTFWSPVLFKAVESLVMSIDSSIFSTLSERSEELMTLGLSIYEILVNMMGNIYGNISAKKLQGQKVNELETQKNKLERKISRWTLLLENTKMDDERACFRYLWAKFCSLQYTMDITDDKLIDSLQDIERAIKSNAPAVNVPYSNFDTIPQLNLAAVQSQLSRLKIIRKITSIENNASEEHNDIATEQQIDSIRRALISDEPLVTSSLNEDLSMEEFLRNSPFLLKVKLWRLLLSYYSRKNKKLAASLSLRIFEILYERLCSESYKAQSHLQRQQTLLLTISCMGSFSREFLEMVANDVDSQVIEPTEAKAGLKVFLLGLNLLYPIVFYESICQRDTSLKSFFNKAVRSSAKLKQIFTDVLTTIIYLCHTLETRCSPTPTRRFGILNLVEASHELLAQFKFCDASDGSYLNLVEQLLYGLNDENGFRHLRQVLWCRYHFTISGENNSLNQHNTKGHDINQRSAVSVGKFLIDSHYKKRNPLVVSGNKTNMKQVLDSIIQVIGDVKFSAHHVLARNEFFLEQYLKSMITTDVLRKAYSGEISLELINPHDSLKVVADTGIFYVASIQALNLYKARKKATQARPSELDSIISSLKTDIIYKTDRFESWYLLGKCYSYIVEDDLIWTSDKLATHEKRKGTTAIQRKSILCHLMALGIALRQKGNITDEMMRSDYDVLVKEIYETLSQELLNGYLKPMDKSCFQWDVPSTLKLKMDGELVSKPSTGAQTVSDYNIQQAILAGISRAIKIDTTPLATQKIQSNWKNFYFSARLIFKRCLHEFKTSGIELLLEACTLSHDMSNAKEIVLEPHYFLVVSSFKMVLKNVIGPHTALSILHRDNSVFKQEDSFFLDEGPHGVQTDIDSSREVFYRRILDLLRGLVAVDKMKWHHRPKYRIAKILYEQFYDTDGAIAEMDEIMFLKSSNKSLVNIWKPEFERPGKHFIYTYQYVVFYLDLLFCRKDYISIALVAKKLKKFSAGMVNVNLASDRALKLFNQLVQERFEVNEKHATDKLLPGLSYTQFIQYSEEIFKTFEKSKHDTDFLETLTHALQLKKGNNGYDGICLALYFKHIYQPFASSKNDQIKSTPDPQFEHAKGSVTASEPADTPHKGKPVTNRKKVSKKDAFEKITALVEKKIA
ncbi:LADA_0A08262g1_1 [Lachancea dasiensis]|uniref:LADA_0A08262g1_1 n=1 Tax=Lachancea dasiensis TaxID=1072105 RepID=A0A1G4IQB3_9SACH|nr:LADA_0A08262g1_1 [Lachancea dasiensis]